MINSSTKIEDNLSEMYKQLMIIRHAKSSWDHSIRSDHERPLNHRGLNDAPMMAERLKAKKRVADWLVSSTATRAISTARFFGLSWGIPTINIEQVATLYHPEPNVFWQVAQAIPNQIGTAAIFSHNPAITQFANSLQIVQLDNMPTCGVLGVRFKTQYWKEVQEVAPEFWFFDWPKNG